MVFLKSAPLGLQSVGLQLFGHQMPFADFHLLLFRVAGDVDDLHPIQERAGNIVMGVGGGDVLTLDKSNGVSM